MLSKEQTEEICGFILSKQEGAYWDFKKKWYENESSDLLHDVICMANNIENRDAYIIIGIDESKDYSINDVSNDPNRKTTQMLVDFFRSKKFVGGIRPHVIVESLDLNGCIDIIIIKNGFYTPYVLEEKYRDVHPYNIYTRVIDSNTPKDKSADIIHIEYLWKKRFHLLDSPKDRVFYLLKNRNDWIDLHDSTSSTCLYYSLMPEYTIEWSPCDDRSGYEYYLFNQTDSTPYWYDIRIKYHQTVIYSDLGVFLDGGRYFTNVPHTDFMYLDDRTVILKYFIEDSKEMKLHNFLYKNDNYDETYAKMKFEESILIFVDEDEKEYFKNYVFHNWSRRQVFLFNFVKPVFCVPDHYIKQEFEIELENAYVLNKMLVDFRNITAD